MTIYQANPDNIAMAARTLRAGELVAFPTETVYGLGADATNPEAVVKIFTAKGRPRFNPLIVHVCDRHAISEFADIPPIAEDLAEAHWPGPMTLILPLKGTAAIADLTVAGLSTVAVCMPAHPVARDLIEAAGRPLAAPSANMSGHVSATCADHVAADFGAAVSVILDAGPSHHGLESSIIDTTAGIPAILRQGAVTQAQIENATGLKACAAGTEQALRPIAPGQLRSHYAPNCAVRLNVAEVAQSEALLAFGPDPLPHAGPLINLSPTGDLVEAACNLFAALRELDQSGSGSIAVMAIPVDGIGAAINDRLNRAAAPRIPNERAAPPHRRNRK